MKIGLQKIIRACSELLLTGFKMTQEEEQVVDAYLKKSMFNVVTAGLLVATLLTGCKMTEEQKSVVDAYIKKRTPDMILEEAQTALLSSKVVNMQVNYSFNYIDKAISQGIQRKGVDYSVYALKGHGYWKGSTKDEEGNIDYEEAYVVPTEEVNEANGSNATDDIEDKYTKFFTTDNGKTWDKIGAENVWSGKVVASLDYSTLKGCEGLILEKGQELINEVYAYHLHGTLSYEQARAFTDSLAELLNMEISDKVTGAESVDIDIYFYDDSRPMMLSVVFHDKESLDSEFTYSTWEVQALYKDYDNPNMMKLSVPSRIRLEVVEKERQKEQENQFDLGGIEVTLPETTAEETEPETDENGNIIETSAGDTDSTESIAETS